MNALIAPLLLPLLAASLPAQSATYSYIDQQAPYSNPASASFTARTMPSIGSAFELQVPMSWVQRNRVGADYLLATGVVNPGVPVTALGGHLYCVPLVVLQTPMSPLGIPGVATMRFVIPNVPALVGTHFYQQILEVPSSNALRLSRGGHGVIGR